MADFELRQEIYTVSLEDLAVLAVPGNKEMLKQNKNSKKKKEKKEKKNGEISTEKSHSGQNWKTSAVK